jgi:Putative prokaryotic signal transducing protein
LPHTRRAEDVVVQERRRVHEFHRRSQPHMPLAAVAAQLGGGDRQHRAQPLAAGVDEMVGELGDQLDVGYRLVQDDAVDGLHVLGDDLQQRLQALCGIPRLFEWDDDAQGVSPCGVRSIRISGTATGQSSPHGCDRGQRPQIRCAAMRELLRSNDTVLIGFAQSVLRQAGIASFVADQYMSVVEGSIGAFPRRLQVADGDWATARGALAEAGLADWLIEDGDARP